MPAFDPNVLLDVPPFPAEGYAGLADRLAALLKTRNDVVFVQGEAIVALEAAATSIATPMIRALNIVTSSYGRLFGQWLRRGGAEAMDIVAEPGMPIGVETFAAALEAQPATNLVAVVHAESATGILNPLPEIARLTRERGALLVVDAVASVAGHHLDVDELGIDVAVIGPQKSLAGPSGISALSVSGRAWAAIMRPDAPTASILSLADIKRSWLDAGRGAPPGMPSALEFHALEAALDRVEAEGIEAVIARHALAARAARNGLRALGLSLWVEDQNASNLVTAVRLPSGLSADAILHHSASRAAELDRAAGNVPAELVRINHTGQRARQQIVVESVKAFGEALLDRGKTADIEAAVAAVNATYQQA